MFQSQTSKGTVVNYKSKNFIIIGQAWIIAII
jgi:hypothetical protein